MNVDGKRLIRLPHVFKIPEMVTLKKINCNS